MAVLKPKQREAVFRAIADPTRLRVVDDWLRDYQELWAQSLQSLKRYVEEDR
jgi:hypothetical protein